MLPLLEASRLETDREMAGIELKMERDYAIQRGMSVYDHDYGFLAFPRRSPDG